MVMTPDAAMMSPSSTISSLTQSTRGDTNQAIRDVLYGVNDSAIEVSPLHLFQLGISASVAFSSRMSYNYKKKI
jgi:hypothetical protein